MSFEDLILGIGVGALLMLIAVIVVGRVPNAEVLTIEKTVYVTIEKPVFAGEKTIEAQAADWITNNVREFDQRFARDKFSWCLNFGEAKNDCFEEVKRMYG